jgi:hypothetical protein
VQPKKIVRDVKDIVRHLLVPKRCSASWDIDFSRKMHNLRKRR